MNKASVLKRLKELSTKKSGKKNKSEVVYGLAAEPDTPYGESGDEAGEMEVLEMFIELTNKQSESGAYIKAHTELLDKKVLTKYPALTKEEIKQLVVEDKWMMAIRKLIKTEMDRISQRLTQRIRELAERYETPLPQQTIEVQTLEEKVKTHIVNMGFNFN